MDGKFRRATKIMLIRHAEKPSPFHDNYGVTPEGNHEKDSLTVRGWQRAGALVCFFAPANGSFQNSSIAQPQFLYSSKSIKHHGSRRPFETIMPLAGKLAIEIDSDFLKDEFEQMVENALVKEGVVLICWQREYIPRIANFILGDNITAPQDWSEQRFDMVWVFDKDSKSDKYHFMQVPQNLLSGDFAALIK
jgi:hypothetical protein